MSEAVRSAPILAINSGSSSLKLGLYKSARGKEQLQFDGLVDGVGSEQATITLRDAGGTVLRSGTVPAANQEAAFHQVLSWFTEVTPERPAAIGHRVVHGGPHLIEHQRITAAVIAELQAAVHYAPLHIPAALTLIEAAKEEFPELPQFACFDTAFHRTLPEAAARFALPGELYEAGVRRYGFHGLSYESLVYQLGPTLPRRAVFAHLGSGASLAAVKDGQSVDTSMGFTPLGGIPMATRSGDLDPGVLLYLLRSGSMDLDELESMLNHDAGLKALSSGMSDMRELQAAARKEDPKATLALEVFCRSVAKTVAAFASVLGGLDLLVFTAGIGERSAAVRHNICERLAFLGVALDGTANAGGAATLSTPGSYVRVCTLPSEEDLQIARHSRMLLHR